MEEAQMPDFVIVTGMSGAGRTEAMHVFEDLGYYCVDNLPSSLLAELVRVNESTEHEGGRRRLAVVCDSRNGDFFGDLEGLPPKLRDLCLRTLEEGDALDGTRFQVNVCLNYGGRDEILRAAKAWAADVQAGRQTPEALTDELFSRYLDSRGVPDPDLIIRPSGELRLSNFLPWQSAYAEFYFTDVLWPDFGPAVLDQALIDYQRRQRRFGGV